jgi:V8-like Glu-specific endopeptidase
MKTIITSLTVIASILLLTVGYCVQTAKTAENAQDATESKAESAADYKEYLEASKKTGGNLEYLKKMPKQKLPFGKRQPKREVPKDNFYWLNVTMRGLALAKMRRKR